MGDQFLVREFGWTESSGSKVSAGPFIEDSEASSQPSEDSETPFAQHGLVLEVDSENIHMQRDF